MRTFLYILSFLFLMNSLVLTARKSFTLGLAIMLLLTAGFFVVGRWWDFWLSVTASGIGFLLKCIVILGVFRFLFLTGYVLSFARSTADFSEKAVIVLGCGLESDGTPAPTLKKRLDGCIGYFHLNPDCYIVVSGGYSRFKNCTEGAAMKKYLTENGIPPDRILVDEKASNTRENFRYAFELIEEAGINAENVCYVTNSFHVYRAGVYAKEEGFKNIKAISVKTYAAVFLPAVMREVCGVAVMMFFKY